MNSMQKMIEDARARRADSEKARAAEAHALAEGWLKANVDDLVAGARRSVPVPRRLCPEFVDALVSAGCEAKLGPHDGLDPDNTDRSEPCTIYHIRIPGE